MIIDLLKTNTRVTEGLGEEIKSEPKTAEEAIKIAGLDWEVEVVPLQTVTGLEAPGRFGIVRTDTNEVIGDVGSRYQTIQNKKVFSFLDQLVYEGAAMYHMAGEIYGGRMIIIQLKLPNDVLIAPDDLCQKYITGITSHDDSSPIVLFDTFTRLWCQNLLTGAKRSAMRQIVIRHTASYENKLDKAREAFGLALDFYSDIENKLKAMKELKLDSRKLTGAVTKLFPLPNNATERIVTTVKDHRTNVRRLFTDGKGNNQPEVAGTLLAFYNGATEYFDHYKKYRGDTEKQNSSRFISNINGVSYEQKRRVMEIAESLI